MVEVWACALEAPVSVKAFILGWACGVLLCVGMWLFLAWWVER